MTDRSRPRRRDRVRNHIQDLARTLPGRSVTPSSTDRATAPATAPQSSASPLQTSLSTQPGQNFLEDALRDLTTEDRRTIRQYLTPTREIGAAVQAAYDAAADKKRECEDRGWRGEFRGRTVVLRDEAGKVLRWLDRFKSVGDVVVNVDPLHASLPWAGIRIILEVSTRLYKTSEAVWRLLMGRR